MWHYLWIYWWVKVTITSSCFVDKNRFHHEINRNVNQIFFLRYGSFTDKYLFNLIIWIAHTFFIRAKPTVNFLFCSILRPFNRFLRWQAINITITHWNSFKRGSHYILHLILLLNTMSEHINWIKQSKVYSNMKYKIVEAVFRFL